MSVEFEIKSWQTGGVLFAAKTESLKAATDAAVRANADLSSADLSYANLRSANLRSANLRSADLGYANLSYADLGSADLSSANLGYANLSSANLSSANLGYANLSYADLGYANLRSADLRSADLRSANLSYADLRYAAGVNACRSTALLILLDQVGKIRAYKLVTADGNSPIHAVKLNYALDGKYEIPNADTNCALDCGAGINLATLPWCMQHWTAGQRILIAEFEAQDIAAIPNATDGKFRVFRCKIVGEKDLVAIGLITRR